MIKFKDIELLFDDNVCTGFSQLSESLYLNDIISELQSYWSGRLVIKSSNYANPPNSLLVNGSYSDILIYLSEDFRDLPSDLISGYQVVFKCYGTTEGFKSIPFPLGCERGSYPYLKNRNWSSRSSDIFFSGALNANRLGVYRELMGLNWIPEKLVGRISRSRFRKALPMISSSPGFAISFTDGFKKGLKPAEYAEALAASKIAICPKGFHSTETFRHYEALKSGCIVISEVLPDVWMYRGSPIVQLASWRTLHKTVEKILGSKDLQEDLHYQSVNWWNDKFSPKAVANFILSNIKNA